MKNKKGFTLVELLAVIVLLGLITVLAVPAINNANAKTKERLYNTKITTAEQAILAWAQENEKCFVSTNAIRCVVGLSSGCTENGNIVSCTVTMGTLASNDLIGYDKEVDGVKQVINPKDNTSMNNVKISFKYNKTKRTFSFK